MFFWFSNETFSIIDALTKLILVITGSALIICFCHKLTNFKKSRRYKYDFVGAATEAGTATTTATIPNVATTILPFNDGPIIIAANGRHQQLTSANRPASLHPVHASQQWSDLCPTGVGARLNGAHPNQNNNNNTYDPYNTISQLGGHNQISVNNISSPSSLLVANNGVGGRQQLNIGAYAYQHPSAALAVFQGLAGLNQQSLGCPLYPTNVVHSDRLAVRTHRPHLAAREFQNEPDEHDACPSYEEAIRVANERQERLEQKQQRQQQSYSQADESQQDEASEEPAQRADDDTDGQTQNSDTNGDA